MIFCSSSSTSTNRYSRLKTSSWPLNDLLRVIDQLLEDRAVVGQVDRVEVRRDGVQPFKIVGEDLAEG